MSDPYTDEQNSFKANRPSKAQRLRMRKNIKMAKCAYCHATENLTIDHKIPISKGGTSAKSNLQCLCSRCNGMKSSMTQREVKKLFQWHTQVVFEKAERKRYNHDLNTPKPNS